MHEQVQRGPNKMRCFADLRCGSEYGDKMRCGPKPKILNIRILCKTLRICGSTAGLLILAGSLFIGVSLRICCGCGPVDFCGPTVYGYVFLCGSTAGLLRIYYSFGPQIHTVFLIIFKRFLHDFSRSVIKVQQQARSRSANKHL